MKIAIQAGHKGMTSGSTGASGERDWTTKIVPLIASRLKKKGYEVYETDAFANTDTKVITTDWDLFLAILNFPSINLVVSVSKMYSRIFKYFEVFWSVVVGIPVYMMHYLSRIKRPANLFGHYISMLKYPSVFVRVWVRVVISPQIVTVFINALIIIGLYTLKVESVFSSFKLVLTKPFINGYRFISKLLGNLRTAFSKGKVLFVQPVFIPVFNYHSYILASYA